MSGRLDFARDGRDWPNREASVFVEADGFRWHVQRMGSGPAAMLLHGAGAATHSWRALAPLLATRLSIVAPDLPGQGFTAPLGRPDYSLPGMARATTALLGALKVAPDIVVGHSAGAAILARLILDGGIKPKLFVSLNGAFKPFDGTAGVIFPPIARALVRNPVVPRLFAWMATPDSVRNLIRGTGSRVEPKGIDYYHRLVGNAGHVGATLAMMASWDLSSLARDVAKLPGQSLYIVGAEDRAVPPRVSEEIVARSPGARLVSLSGTGHLAHEEQPEAVARLILDASVQAGVLSA
jgi:magnesium chelatase accessory protein